MWRKPIEQLERRQLLSAFLEGSATIRKPGVAATGSVLLPQSQSPFVAPAANGTLQIDAVAVRDELIRFVDTWNGGQAGKLGTSGMGVYAAT